MGSFRVGTRTSGRPVVSPRLCPVNIECRLQQTLSLGSHDLFIGEVVAIQMDEAVLNEKGRLDFAKAAPFAYLGGEYRQVGELLGRFGYSKKGASP